MKAFGSLDAASSGQVEHSHANTGDRDEGAEAVADHGCTADHAAKSGFVGLDEGGPDGADVGGGADDEQGHDDHAVEAEECALCHQISTISCV